MTNALSPKQRSAIERAKRHAELLPLLFAKASGTKWIQAFIDSGFLDPAKLPEPQPATEPGYSVIPSWPVLDYLVRISPDLAEAENSTAAQNVMTFIREVSRSAKERGISNYRVWYQFTKILPYLPIEVLREDDWQLLDYWLSDKFERGIVAESAAAWVRKLIETNTDRSRSLALSALRTLYDVEVFESSNPLSVRSKLRLRFDAWHGRKVNALVCRIAGKSLGASAIDLLRSRLTVALESLGNDSWTSVWRPAIEDHEQNASRDDAEHVLIEAFREVLLGYCDTDREEMASQMEATLRSENRTVARIAVYVLNQQYAKLRILASDVLDPRYFTAHFRHEMWHFLYDRFAELTDVQQRLVLTVIEERLDRPEDTPQSLAYLKACWYAAIRRFSPDFNTRFLSLVEFAGSAPDHPDFTSYMTVGWVEDVTPISSDDLHSLTPTELVQALNSYTGERRFGGPTIRGLAKAVRVAFTADPQKILGAWNVLVTLKLPYVNEILEAYSEVWKERPGLVWEDLWPALLQFCDAITQRTDFWDEVPDDSEFVGNRYWVIGAISRLIESGSRSDDRAFAEELLPLAERIIFRILDRESGEEIGESSDAVSIAINSPRGRALEALINLALRECRLDEKKVGNHESAWAKFEARFDSELGRISVREYEFVTLAANYLPNFKYMSAEWTIARLSTIFSRNDYVAWVCAMQGYSYVGQTDKQTYSYLARNGDFLRALDDQNISEKVTRSIVQRITLAYLSDALDEENLMCALLRRGREAELGEVVWFVWSLRSGGPSPENIDQSRVFALWRAIINAIDFDSRAGQKLAGNLCDWIVFVDVVNDETRSLLESVIPFAGIAYNTHDVLHGISRISQRQPKEAADLWLKLVQSTSADFPEEAVKSSFENLLQSGADGVRLAKIVADAYLSKGNDGPHRLLQAAISSQRRNPDGS